MKKHIALYAIAAAALLAVPATIRAEDAPAAKPDAPAAAPAAKKHGSLPFHGKVTAVDTTAMTVTIGTKTYNITSDTKITKDGEPATLADIIVGTMIGGAYKKDGDKLNATTINTGQKADKGSKKKKADTN